jgi:hypothetical protein
MEVIQHYVKGKSRATTGMKQSHPSQRKGSPKRSPKSLIPIEKLVSKSVGPLVRASLASQSNVRELLAQKYSYMDLYATKKRGNFKDYVPVPRKFPKRAVSR